jgi:flagellar basal-body rod modification protein FlgD
MSAGAIGNLGQLAGQQSQSNDPSNRTGSSPYADMESGEFVNLLVQQLTSQDPMDPQDSSKILEQLSSIRNIESQMQLQGKLEDLVSQNQVSKASGLIGKTVEGVDASNDQVSGRVTAVRVQDDQAVLELDTGKRLAMGRVTMITQSPATEG